jgi:hypothetical protein
MSINENQSYDFENAHAANGNTTIIIQPNEYASDRIDEFLPEIIENKYTLIKGDCGIGKTYAALNQVVHALDGISIVISPTNGKMSMDAKNYNISPFNANNIIADSELIDLKKLITNQYHAEKVLRFYLTRGFKVNVFVDECHELVDDNSEHYKQSQIEALMNTMHEYKDDINHVIYMSATFPLDVIPSQFNIIELKKSKQRKLNLSLTICNNGYERPLAHEVEYNINIEDQLTLIYINNNEEAQIVKKLIIEKSFGKVHADEIIIINKDASEKKSNKQNQYHSHYLRMIAAKKGDESFARHIRFVICSKFVESAIDMHTIRPFNIVHILQSERNIHVGSTEQFTNRIRVKNKDVDYSLIVIKDKNLTYSQELNSVDLSLKRKKIFNDKYKEIKDSESKSIKKIEDDIKIFKLSGNKKELSKSIINLSNLSPITDFHYHLAAKKMQIELEDTVIGARNVIAEFKRFYGIRLNVVSVIEEEYDESSTAKEIYRRSKSLNSKAIKIFRKNMNVTRDDAKHRILNEISIACDDIISEDRNYKKLLGIYNGNLAQIDFIFYMDETRKSVDEMKECHLKVISIECLERDLKKELIFLNDKYNKCEDEFEKGMWKLRIDYHQMTDQELHDEKKRIQKEKPQRDAIASHLLNIKGTSRGANRKKSVIKMVAEDEKLHYIMDDFIDYFYTKVNKRLSDIQSNKLLSNYKPKHVKELVFNDDKFYQDNHYKKYINKMYIAYFASHNDMDTNKEMKKHIPHPISFRNFVDKVEINKQYSEIDIIKLFDDTINKSRNTRGLNTKKKKIVFINKLFKRGRSDTKGVFIYTGTKDYNSVINERVNINH